MRRSNLLLFALLVLGLFFFVDPALAQEAAEEGSNDVSLFQLIQYGGLIGYLLIFLSVATMGLGIEHVLTFKMKRDELVDLDLVQQLEDLFEAEEYEEAMNLCEERPGYLSNIFVAALPRMTGGYDSMADAVNEQLAVEANKLNQKISWVGLISAVAPLIGLFGTVTGMIGTFNTIATAPTTPPPSKLAAGIQQALVTTCLGLFVAIPANMVFFWARNTVTSIILECNGIVDELLAKFRE